MLSQKDQLFFYLVLFFLFFYLITYKINSVAYNFQNGFNIVSLHMIYQKLFSSSRSPVWDLAISRSAIGWSIVTDSSPVLSQCVPAWLAQRPASITTPQASFINV